MSVDPVPVPINNNEDVWPVVIDPQTLFDAPLGDIAPDDTLLSTTPENTFKRSLWSTIAEMLFVTFPTYLAPFFGAVPRIPTEKMAEIVSPEDFGAVGDGGVDDTAALQRALDTGGNIRFKAGATYRVTGTLNLTVHGTTIEGNGATLSLPDAGLAGDILSAVEIHDLHIEKLNIDGGRGNKTGILGTGMGGRGILLRGCQRFTITGCIIQEVYRTGIWAGAFSADSHVSTDFSINGNIVRNVGDGTARGDGIWLFGLCSRFVVANNVLTDCQHVGIHVDDSSDGAEPNRECRDFVISGNQIRLNAPVQAEYYGIRVDASERWSVTDNNVYGYRHGIRAWHSQTVAFSGRAVISGNNVTAIGSGIYLQGTIRNTLVEGNNIFVTDNVQAVAGINCPTFSSSAIGHRSLSVIGNHIETPKAGILFSSTIADNNTDVVISENVLRFVAAGAAVDDTQTGIDMLRLERSIVKDNHIRSFWIGIRAQSTCVAPKIIGNSVEDSGLYALSVNSADNLIARNVTTGPNTGIFFAAAADSATTTVADNIFADTTPSSGTYSLTRHKNNIGLPPPTNTYTIAGGVLTVPAWEGVRAIRVDTEGGAAADDLDSIAGGQEGQIIIMSTVTGSRDVTVIDGIPIAMAGNFIMGSAVDHLTVVKRGAGWFEVARSDNG